ncbi:HupE/UreJ family protein [Amantichitinum ursilacus]|uniref:HupE / UreJ protein n=1 Tax=Amantichitinum ursilacus TaxID=857265 RepID=A0A0N1JS37_9NEIS|nr:HupE/UreJ family protein [Amantichitinum ursilacus]KPC50560.1 HupE / UreJ protein [Amantichitinum ursilacus]
MRRRLLIALLLCPGLAQAHAAFVGAGDFYAGALHPLTSPEHLLLLLVFGLLLGQQGRASLGLAWFALSALAGALLADRVGVDAGSGVLLLALLGGAALAVARPLPRLALWALVVAAGALYGLANGAAREGQMALYPFTAGVVLVAFLALAYLLQAAQRLWNLPVSWVKVGVRVLGSWTVAIGLMVLALAARGKVVL